MHGSVHVQPTDIESDLSAGVVTQIAEHAPLDAWTLGSRCVHTPLEQGVKRLPWLVKTLLRVFAGSPPCHVEEYHGGSARASISHLEHFALLTG